MAVAAKPVNPRRLATKDVAAAAFFATIPHHPASVTVTTGEVARKGGWVNMVELFFGRPWGGGGGGCGAVLDLSLNLYYIFTFLL